MISLEEAEQLIAHSSKYNHSHLVSRLMGCIAASMDVDIDTWMLVGLLHDLDFDETSHDRSKHGVMASNRLKGILPVDGLDAIMRHDHRTGILPQTDLDYGLILCDAVSVVLEDGNLMRPVSLEEFNEMLTQVDVEKPWIRDLIYKNPVLEKIDLRQLLETE